MKLRDFYDGKRPVVLTFLHSCPVLCSIVLDATASGLRGIGWNVGKEFDVVTISIDPEESLEKTAAKRAGILAEYGASRGHDGKGWHFLVGDKAWDRCGGHGRWLRIPSTTRIRSSGATRRS